MGGKASLGENGKSGGRVIQVPAFAGFAGFRKASFDLDAAGAAEPVERENEIAAEPAALAAGLG